MKLKIQSSKLRDGFTKILTVIDKKNTRPILTNCLFNVKENHIEILATDLEVTAKILLNVNVEKTGQFCINTKNIYDILKELPDSELELSINENENILNISCNNIKYSLLVVDSKEYPQINFETYGKPFKLKSKDLVNIINKTSHAISTDETRINLNGIFLQQLDSKLRAVAIDGHRLALLDINKFESDNSTLRDGIIIPRKGIVELKKLAETFIQSDLIMAIDDSFMYLSANDEQYLSVRLISREYPKYQTVIPNKTIFSMTVDRISLLNAVKRIRILSNEKTNGIKTNLKNGQLTISANHPSFGNATETINVSYTGTEMEIGFNAKYMLESLSVMEVSDVTFEFNNELSPIIIRSDEIPDFLGIIMPLKL